MTPASLSEHVIDESLRRVVFGANQPEYFPLPAILFPDGKILTEWEVTEEERGRIARGERIRLWIWTGGQPLQPVALEITDETQA